MAKRVPPLTAATVAKTKPHPLKTVELVDGAVPGLRLRITPSNTRTWSLNIRSNGVMRRFLVGEGLGLADARQRAEAVRRQVKDGADPTAERRARRQESMSAKLGIGTFESVIDEYFASGSGAGLRTRLEQTLRIKSVFKTLLPTPALRLGSPDLQRSVDAHEAKVAASRAVGYVRPVIRWAVRRGQMQGQFDFEKPIVDAPVQRVLTISELKALLPTLSGGHGNCCLFMLLTGARRDEACGATWGQIDMAACTWTIPGDDRKDTRAQAKRKLAPKPPMAVPLSRQALNVLRAVQEAEVVRRQIEGIHSPVEPEDLVFVGPKGKRLGNWNRWVKNNIILSGVAGWHPHALRRTTATLAGDLGAAPHIVSVILGHKNIGGQLTAGYNKSRYTTEHAEVLQRVADLVFGVST